MAHHGNTPAAWTAVMIILVGFVVGGIGLVIDNWTMFWVGVALRPVGAHRRQGHAEDGDGRGARLPLSPDMSAGSALDPGGPRWPTRAAGGRGCGRRSCSRSVCWRPASLLHVRDPHRAGQLGVLPLAGAHRHRLPGCGGLRAVNDLTRGDVAAAASSNLLFVGSLPVFAWWWLRRVHDGWRGRARRQAPTRAALRSDLRWSWASCVAFWVVRNLPFAGWLAP